MDEKEEGELKSSESERRKREFDIQDTVIDLISDAALPSPIVSYCCSNEACLECYAVLSILAEYGALCNLTVEQCTALRSYLGSESSSVESDDGEESYVDTDVDESDTSKVTLSYNSPVDDYSKNVAEVWKGSLPDLKQKSFPTVEHIRTLMRYVCVPGYVMKTKHTSECASCRRDYQPLYQEFGVFLYPQKRSEIGLPPMFYGSLSDGTTVARTFQLYLYTPHKSAKKGHDDKNNNQRPFLGDVALLETVDPTLVTKEDYHILRLNGFAHEIGANGTIYWARGIVYQEFGFESECVIKAAVETRLVARDPKSRDGSIICCTETIKKWLDNMGFSEKGFSVMA